ncbi:MAG TPA: NADH-quinone oxidoreductase subunit NuoB [Gemmatimonadaceae bacterium]|nr:NADH-quinone oxidoreductase subunit NuoB [Gemmatimonadaceae bacterium]
MLEFLRARLRQRVAPASLDPGESGLPARFRGRPVVAQGPAAVVGDDASLGAGLPERAGRRLPIVDLGRSVFAPEQAEDGESYSLRFTQDYRMATRRRDALLTSTGEIELARALDVTMRRLLGRSLRLRQVAAGSCGGCEAELVALGNVVFDMARFGIQFVASPRHADGILVTGAISANMHDALLKTYEAVPDPRIVVAVGACAISGGVFGGSAEVLGGVPAQIPVDLWVPGCPPHPLTVLDGLLRLLGRVEGSTGLDGPQRT